MAGRQCHICGFELHPGIPQFGRYLFRTPSSIQTGITRSSSFVCSIHFENSCLKVISNPVWYLKQGSIPTKYLNSLDTVGSKTRFCMVTPSPFQSRMATGSSTNGIVREKSGCDDVPTFILHKLCKDSKNISIEEWRNPENLSSRLRKLTFNTKTRKWSYDDSESERELPIPSDNVPDSHDKGILKVSDAPSMPRRARKARPHQRMSHWIRKHPDRFSPTRKTKADPIEPEHPKGKRTSNYIRMKKSQKLANVTHKFTECDIDGAGPERDVIDGVVFTSFFSAEQLEDFVANSLDNNSKSKGKLETESQLCTSQEALLPLILPTTVITPVKAKDRDHCLAKECHTSSPQKIGASSKKSHTLNRSSFHRKKMFHQIPNISKDFLYFKTIKRLIKKNARLKTELNKAKEALAKQAEAVQ